MNVIWFGLAVYAVIEAIAAAGRVRQKRRALRAAPRSKQQNLDRPSASQSRQSSLQPDATPISAQPAASPPEQSAPDLPKNLPEDLPNLSPADLNLPLAVSVSVTDLTQTHPEPAEFDLNLVPPELALPIELEPKPASEHASEHSSVLAEVAQLSRQTDAVAHFQRYLNHPDSVVRAATVFELGELAAKQPGEAGKILELLTPLDQDPNSQVRAQVVVALAKIQSAIS